MRKLSELGYNSEKIKGSSFEWFCKNVDAMVKLGTISQPSKAEIRKFYEKITGKQIKTKE